MINSTTASSAFLLARTPNKTMNTLHLFPVDTMSRSLHESDLCVKFEKSDRDDRTFTMEVVNGDPQEVCKTLNIIA